MPWVIIDRDKDWSQVGFWVGNEVICHAHMGKRRNPNNYQPAVGLDMQKNPCKKCAKKRKD